MADSSQFRAAPALWKCCENDAARWDGAIAFHCILELRARIEALEAANEARAIEIIKLTNACAAASNQAQFHADITADEDDAVPTGSLVERVAAAIADKGWPTRIWRRDARAVIREVAAWLRENEAGYNAVRLLEREGDL
jgi:predicted neuraminidase